MLSKILKFTPHFLKKEFRDLIINVTAPRTIYGYKNLEGKHCPRTRLSSTVYIYHPENVEIEDNIFIGHYVILDGTGKLKIKEGAHFSVETYIFTHSAHISIRLLGNNYMDVPEYNKAGYVIAPVEVGKYAWIGIGAKILPCMRIGDYSIVGAGSIMNRDIPSYSIAIEVPAKMIGSTVDLDPKEYERLNLQDKWYSFIDTDYEMFQTLWDSERNNLL